MRGYVGVLLSIYVFKQIQILDAYILSCNASLQTITHVTMCPSDISAYEEAVQKKNCSSLAPDTQTCQSFQYHCVLSDDFKNAIEVCAPSMLIIGHVCTKFSTRYRSIMRIAGFACNDSAITCPYGYNSTQAFLHTLCYAKISGQFTSDIPLSKEGVTNRDTREKDEEKINNSKLWWILLVTVVLITVSLVGVLFYRKRRNTIRRRKGISANRYPLLTEEQHPPINDLLLISRGTADQLLQEDPNTKHFDTTLSHEESRQKEQSNTKNGSQLLKTETFQEPLTGSSKDFIGINKDYATETYKKTPYSELTEGSADFKKKCDMFSSKETSKFPGYRKYKTRAMSFDGADKWLEVKKEEFAKYGFLYKGVGSKTTCFHCGCLKDDWTKEDDILSTHVFLEKSCAYVQYLMEQE